MTHKVTNNGLHAVDSEFTFLGPSLVGEGEISEEVTRFVIGSRGNLESHRHLYTILCDNLENLIVGNQDATYRRNALNNT